ncbi:hypothetical protein RE476_04805 [Methanolobus mangrovi]|uniref:Uncharacterized protein n=1 Tax=Methanolobus mangrovi TaxID=3072977 RepID=A0AA51UJA9_9EURY|nr:hypothetical protein [Methanolobus mangrovi]WMW23152.1 hypothetical protein RE476_04805 [Methanolobus mangrovi]
MSNFHKRDYERKGDKKNEELDAKLIQENLKDLKSSDGEISE